MERRRYSVVLKTHSDTLPMAIESGMTALTRLESPPGAEEGEWQSWSCELESNDDGWKCETLVEWVYADMPYDERDLREKLNWLWGSLSMDETLRLSKEEPTLVQLCQDNHELLYHSDDEIDFATGPDAR